MFLRSGNTMVTFILPLEVIRVQSMALECLFNIIGPFILLKNYQNTLSALTLQKNKAKVTLKATLKLLLQTTAVETWTYFFQLNLRKHCCVIFLMLGYIMVTFIFLSEGIRVHSMAFECPLNIMGPSILFNIHQKVLLATNF